jgi:hypothetical protein
MIYLYAIIAIVTGVLLALKGLKNYRLLLSLAVTLSNGSLYLSISDMQPEVLSPLSAIIIAVISGVLTYLLARFITYFWLYVFQMYFMIALMIIFINPESLSGGVFVGILFLTPLIGTILMRKHIKPIVIGLMSGFSSGVGISILVILFLLKSTDLQAMDFESLISNIRIPLITLILLTLSGVLFQYFYILKKNPELSKI